MGGDRAKHALIGQCDLFAASRHSQDYTSDLFTQIGSTFMEINLELSIYTNIQTL